MNKHDITLIFPPAHDISMPHLSLPLLKGFIKRNRDIDCTTIDLNLQFFNTLVDYSNGKQILNDALGQENPETIISAALSFQNISENKANDYLNRYRGYGCSLRKIKYPFTLTDSRSLDDFLQKQDNPIDIILLSIINSDSFPRSNIFGITFSVEDQIIPGFVCANILRRLFPGSLILLGGSIITRLHKNILSSPLSKYYDYLIIKEGEFPLLDIIDTFVLQQNKSLSNTKIYHHSDVFDAKRNYQIFDIHKTCLPDYSDYSFKEYLSPIPIAPILVTRKCNWGECDFCSIHTSWDGKHRARNIPTVMDEISMHIKNGINHIRFVDETLPTKIIDNLSDEIIINKHELYYEAYCRFEDRFLNKDFCKKLYNSGLRQIFWGLESIGSVTLKRVNKAIECGSEDYKKKITKILQNTNEAGIMNYVFVLVGIPNTPSEEEYETIEYIKANNDIHVVALASFVVDKDSPIDSNPEITAKYGIELIPNDELKTEVGFRNVLTQNSLENIQERAKVLLTNIFKNRPDLALSSLLNDDIRFVIASKCGNHFVRKYLGMNTDREVNQIIDLSIQKVVEERIVRTL